MSSGEIRITKQDALATLTIAHVERSNALSFAMFEDLIRAVDNLSMEESVRVIVLRGEGQKAFSTGADTGSLTGSSQEVSRHGGDQLSALGHALATCRKPVLAMIYGYCFGGATGIVAACDMRYAADTAWFSIPAARLGIVYPVRACRDLCALIGPGRLAEMLMSARRYSAGEALAMGLVDRVFPEQALEHEVMEIARQIAENAPLSVQGAKRVIRHLREDWALQHTEEMERLVAGSFLSEDFREGLQAFAQKRKPRFIGK